MATLVNYLLNQPLNRKNTLKQVTVVLIKACFPLLVFNLATKLIHKSNSEEGLYAVGRRGGGYNQMYLLFGVWPITRKNNRFPILDILGYLKNTHKNPKFGKVRQVLTREFPTKFPRWDLSYSSKFGIFVGIL